MGARALVLMATSRTRRNAPTCDALPRGRAEGAIPKLTGPGLAPYVLGALVAAGASFLPIREPGGA